MKAVQINKYGGVEVLEVKDIPEPTLKELQVLVKIYSASINPIDYKVRGGSQKDKITLPITLGGDFAGVVSKMDSGVTEFKEGDEVFGSVLVLNGGSGAFAQFAAANTGRIALKPKNLDFTESAALPLVGSSAVQSLEEHINLQKDQKILIHGGAGGIGHVAIQLAKAIGAYVVTTVGSEDVEYVKDLGVDQVIDYTKDDFSKNPPVGGFDAVFTTVGGDVIDKSYGVLKKGGVIVSMVGQLNEELAKEKGITAIAQGTHTNTQHLKRVKELVEEGKIKVHVDKIFTLDQAKEAFTYQEQNHPRGKVVFKIK